MKNYPFLPGLLLLCSYLETVAQSYNLSLREAESGGFLPV